MADYQPLTGWNIVNIGFRFQPSFNSLVGNKFVLHSVIGCWDKITRLTKHNYYLSRSITDKSLLLTLLSAWHLVTWHCGHSVTCLTITTDTWTLTWDTGWECDAARVWRDHVQCSGGCAPGWDLCTHVHQCPLTVHLSTAPSITAKYDTSRHKICFGQPK